jgi:hypothetical protein
LLAEKAGIGFTEDSALREDVDKLRAELGA